MNHNLSSLKKIIKLNKVILQSRKGGQDKNFVFFFNKFNGLRFQICHSVKEMHEISTDPRQTIWHVAKHRIKYTNKCTRAVPSLYHYRQ